MRNKCLILILTFSIFMFQTGAFAATTKGFKGAITVIDSASQSFQISNGDSVSEKEKNVNILVVSDTLFNGVSSLDELRPGDEVSVEAVPQEKSELWEARSISLVKVKIRDTAL